ncbi:MAG: phosphatase PAP2 family protein [Ghiorsea sp.]
MKKILALIYINILIPVWIWNQQIFLFLNEQHSAFADQVFAVITGMADFRITLLIVFVVMLFHVRLGLAALLTYFLAGASNQILKSLFETPRPPALYEHLHILGDVLTTPSFPSGHATASGACAYLFFLLWSNKPKLVMTSTIIFSLVAYGRIYGGVHFPLDVLVGFTMGALIMYGADKLSKCWGMSHGQDHVWLWRLPSIAIVLLSFYIYTSQAIQPVTAGILTQVLPLMALLVVLQSWWKRTSYGN